MGLLSSSMPIFGGSKNVMDTHRIKTGNPLAATTTGLPWSRGAIYSEIHVITDASLYIQLKHIKRTWV